MAGRTIQVSGFPLETSADTVKEFLEAHTGEGTVDDCKIRGSKATKPASKLYAIVQFTSSRYADHITLEADRKCLKFESYPLVAREIGKGIDQKPKTSMPTLENISLHLGCQISTKEFISLWEVGGVTANFGFRLKKMEFLLSYLENEYKLELHYSGISQIDLQCQYDNEKMLLLIQLRAAPRIYKRNTRCSKSNDDVPILNCSKDSSDHDHWVRTTDFTPASCVGQASALGLVIPQKCKLPEIKENFYHFKEHSGEFHLRAGHSYCRSLSLVPTVEPVSVHLPFRVLFKVNSLVHQGILVGPTLDIDFYNLVDPSEVPIAKIEHGLESLSQLKKSCFQPAKFLREKYKTCQISKGSSSNYEAFVMNNASASIHRIQVTPSKVYFCGPEVIVSNRVLRNYPEDINNFLRVSFVDEGAQKIRSTDLVRRNYSNDDDKETDIYKRILYILKNGIVIGEKRFQFLAFSSSQLRENSLWMFASRDELSAADIRRWMGDFSDIRNVAKYAARLGQSFSSSKETLSVNITDVAVILDVKSENIEYIFSDGIGKISADFARAVAKKHDLKITPSAFQIRYAGYKGVVAVDPLSVQKLSLRNSMYKYKSRNTTVDVLNWSKYQPCFLNRQLITLLSTLGVPDDIFEKKQREIMEQLDEVLIDPTKARDALDFMCPGENSRLLKDMLMCGYKPSVEPFLSTMLQAFRESKLSELRTRSRLFVPLGRCMMGCLDETRTLNYGQVFVKASFVNQKKSFASSAVSTSRRRSSSSGRGSFVVEGKVIVAKNPCLHPGDIRILTAVDVPALHHMVDCIVFPQKGERPHPYECSGSDLDGDVYFVCWDPDLIPPRQVTPMEYDKSPPKKVDHVVTIEEVAEYFTNYMVNDSLGVIANAHVVFADKEELKAESAACLELANLFSIAVDFPKTGIPAKIPPWLQVSQYPDFMEKPEKDSYESTQVIGKLYRAVKGVISDEGHVKDFTFDTAKNSYDREMEVDGFEDYAADARYCKGKYDFKLGNLMSHYGIKTEAEIISGSIIELSNYSSKKRNTEAIAQAVKSLRKDARHWFEDRGTDSDKQVYAKASAWYHVTYHPSYWGEYNEGLDRPHFLSFAWVVHDKLIEIKKRKLQRRQTL